FASIKYIYILSPNTNIFLDGHLQPNLSDFAMPHLKSYVIYQSNTISTDSNIMKFWRYMPEEFLRQCRLSLTYIYIILHWALDTLENSLNALYFTDNQPESLRSFKPLSPSEFHHQNIPVEDDEHEDFMLCSLNNGEIAKKIPV
ncbi:interleukin-1 receptor-associated kinase 3, partial [Alligator mississippiensis]|uniref:interleukin-1 receptor-associated kinase 3 n=1 Tax=Alligator mississippiensis TaxID=8496 RepID=UPI002877323D